MSYFIQILPRAERQLASLEKKTYEVIKSKIASLAHDPRPSGCQKLKDRAGWRIRVGNYRIIYEIEDTVRIVSILEVGHRREIYR